MRRRRDPEIIAGRVNADGSIAAGDGFTVQKGAAGIYTLTFTGGFRPLSVTPTGGDASINILSAIPLAGGAFQINAWASSFVLTDRAFNFTAVGVQA